MSEPPTILLSVDPGANGGWCLWRDGQYEECGLMDGKQITPMYRLISGIHMGCKHYQRKVFVTESQFLKNMKGFISLVERRVRWQAVAEMFGWEVVILNTATWQSKAFKGLPKKQTKENSKTIAREIIGYDPVTDDVADAICIGKVWLEMDGMSDEEKAILEAKKKPKRKTKRSK